MATNKDSSPPGATLSPRFAEPLTVKLAPSYALAAVLAGAHAAALALALWLPVWWGWKAVLIVGIVANGYDAIRRHALRATANAITVIHHHPDKGFRLGPGGDARLRALWLHPRVTIASFKTAQGARGVVLTADAIAGEAFSQLRARLRASLQSAREPEPEGGRGDTQ